MSKLEVKFSCIGSKNKKKEQKNIHKVYIV